MIIEIEGTDGSGKATQSKLLCEKLKLIYGDNMVKIQSFPNYDSLSCGPVKMYLAGELGKKASDVNPVFASCLYAVDRFCTMKQYEEFLAGGGVLVLDRYVGSNLIHNAGKIEDLNERKEFCKWANNFEYELLKLPKPDIILFLDMPIEKSLSLNKSRNMVKGDMKRDIHEEDSEHLRTAYNAAKVASKLYGWTEISCVENGEIRTPEAISDDIIKAVVKHE